MNIKKMQGYFRDALTPKAIKEQLKPGSVLSKIFLFSFVGAVALGFIYSFILNNLVGTRASSEMISATTAVSKPQVALNEEFTVNVLLAAPSGKKVSQLDLRLNFPVDKTTGDVTYTAGGYESAAVGTTETNYFDTLVLEEVTGTAADKKLRLVLSARKTEDKLSDKVLVKVKFKGTENGKVSFNLDQNNMEIVGPGGAGTEPVSYSIGVGSVTSSTVEIGTKNDLTPTVPAGCFYKQVQCAKAPCPPVLECPSATPMRPSATPVPTSTTAPGQPSATPAPSNTPAPPTPTQTTDTKPTPTITNAPAPACTTLNVNGQSQPISFIEHTTNGV